MTLIGTSGCHLCDDATEMVQSVLTNYPHVTFVASDLSDDPDWSVRYADKIPVVLINDTEHAFWRVSAEKFREELDAQMALSSQADVE